MSRQGLRAGAAILVLGLLFVWLVRPVGNACPDVDRLPAGSAGSSAPSFAPPLTRTCTYTTPDGTQARKRYVPLLDLVALLFAAGVVGGAIAMVGPGRRAAPAPRQSEPRWAAPRERSPLPEPEAWPGVGAEPQPPAVSARSPAAGDEDGRATRDAARRERDAAERARARREREARRGG